MTPSDRPANELHGVFHLIGDSFRLYFKHFQLFFGYAAWLLIPLVLTILAFITFDETIVDVANILFNVLLYGILAAWLTVVVIKLTPIVSTGKAVRTRKISMEAWLSLIPFLLISILVGIINVVGFFLLVIPGLLFITWFAFATVIVVLEHGGVLESLKKSRELSRGRFFPVFWRILAGALLVSFFYFLGLVIVTMVSLALSGGDVDLYLATTPSITDEILYRFVEIFFLPIYVIYQTLLYLDLKGTLDKSETA